MTARASGLVVVGCVAASALTAILLHSATAADPNAAKFAWGDGPPVIAPPRSEMLRFPAGQYVLGDESPQASGDAPRRTIELSAFEIDAHEVTNGQFAEFASSTGYVTTAERDGGGWIYRGGARDWAFVRGATWRSPLGPGSDIEQAMGHPVVLVSWHDAAAYAKWAGKRLPTEAEWEVTARSGLPSGVDTQAKTHSVHEGHATSRSGNPSDHAGHTPSPGTDVPDGINAWQGIWPHRNELKDAYFYTSPVGAFPPNAAGVYDALGNVWEWTADWYAADAYVTGSTTNPMGPTKGELKVARGGSWFCSPNYCSAYRPGFRGKSPPDRGFNNVGFRCARSVSD